MIYPVILCGGSGTRLWQISRKAFPKQFTPLVGKQKLPQSNHLVLAKAFFGNG